MLPTSHISFLFLGDIFLCFEINKIFGENLNCFSPGDCVGYKCGLPDFVWEAIEFPPMKKDAHVTKFG